MAKLKGILKLVGTLEGLTIYETPDGYVVKRKWGPDAERLKKDPAYKAIRQHQLEFGECTRAAKLLRDVLIPVLEGSLDNRVSSRLNKVMNSVKNLDDISVPGKRNVSNGFAAVKGRDQLKGFEFNIRSRISQVLLEKFSVERKQERIRFEELAPKKDLRYPKGASHIVLQSGLAVVDFKTKRSSLVENSIVLPLASSHGNLKLSFKGKGRAKGLKVLVLKIAFLQEVNERQMALNNGFYNAAAIVDVWI